MFTNTLGDFEISGERRTLVFSGGEVKNGLLFGETRLRYEAENPSKLRITIDSENNMGDLVVFAAGREISRQRLPRGVHEFSLPQLRGQQLIELAAESSEWKVWAPTLYQISKVEIESAHAQESFIFALDARRFERGTIELDMRSLAGQIEVLLNGNIIHMGAADDMLIIPFSTAFEHNSLELRAVGDSHFAGTAYVRYTLSEKVIHKLEMPYTLSSGEIKKLPGRIVYEIAAVHTAGAISIKNIHEDGESLIVVEPVRRGTRMLVLREEHVRAGENMLVIEGLDEALFTLKDLWIVV